MDCKIRESEPTKRDDFFYDIDPFSLHASNDKIKAQNKQTKKVWDESTTFIGFLLMRI